MWAPWSDEVAMRTTFHPETIIKGLCVPTETMNPDPLQRYSHSTKSITSHNLSTLIWEEKRHFSNCSHLKDITGNYYMWVNFYNTSSTASRMILHHLGTFSWFILKCFVELYFPFDYGALLNFAPHILLKISPYDNFYLAEEIVRHSQKGLYTFDPLYQHSRYLKQNLGHSCRSQRLNRVNSLERFYMHQHFEYNDYTLSYPANKQTYLVGYRAFAQVHQKNFSFKKLVPWISNERTIDVWLVFSGWVYANYILAKYAYDIFQNFHLSLVFDNSPLLVFDSWVYIGTFFLSCQINNKTLHLPHFNVTISLKMRNNTSPTRSLTR